MAPNTSGSETRSRLLEAAAEVFAECGYRHAKIQDICRRAKANVAAVNYHFGDKERLYTAVIEYALDPSRAHIPYLDVDPGDPPETRLYDFIHSFLSSMLGSGKPAWIGRLVARETIEPTAAMDLMIEKAFRPLYNGLHTIVRELLGPGHDDAHVRLCTASIISQCVTYKNCQTIVMRMNPAQGFDSESLRRLADHIARFSLAGIRGSVFEDTCLMMSAAGHSAAALSEEQ